MRGGINQIKQNFKNDFPASIVVLLVAIPLCLGIALASGAPLISGIIAGVVGGIVVGSLSGSSLGVSGPAAGLAVIVLSAIEDVGGAFEIFLVAVVLGGVIQLILGFLKAGIIGYYFPNSVIRGMLAAIGIIIVLKQVPHAVGYHGDPVGEMAFSQIDGENTFSELGNMLQFLTPGAIVITLIALGILLLWETKFMKRQSWSQFIPGPLIAVLSSIGLGILFRDIPSLTLKGDQMVNLPVADSFQGFFGQLYFPDFSMITDPVVLKIAFVIAMVASLETLLSVEATDKLDPQKRITPTNRELKAQGAGNIISGLLGGLPITQVIVRSSANVQSGGKTKMSAIYHGIMLFGSVLLIPHVLNLIPLASLAAVLFVVGYKLAKPSLFKSIYAKGWSQFVPFVATILAIVFTDLLYGTLFGLAVALMFILWRNYKTPYFFKPEEHEEGRTIRLELAEHVTFLNKASMLQTLNHIPENSSLIIDGSRTIRIDPDVIDIIEDFKINAESKNIEVSLVGMDKGPEGNDPVMQFRYTMDQVNKNGDTPTAKREEPVEV